MAHNVARLMGDQRAAILFTSPPYGQQRDYGAAKEHVRDWDGLMSGVFQHAEAALTPDGQILVNLGMIHRDGEWIPYWNGWIAWMREQGWRRFGWYVWDKGFSARDEGGRFSTSHEWVFHFNRQSLDPAKWIECKTAGKTTAIPAKFSDSQGQYQAITKMHTRASHRIAESIIRVNRGASRQVDHPAAFPVELSPNYCDVIVLRVSRLTATPAILESTGQTFEEVAKERGVAVP